jgi:hypothetical protein
VTNADVINAIGSLEFAGLENAELRFAVQRGRLKIMLRGTDRRTKQRCFSDKWLTFPELEQMRIDSVPGIVAGMVAEIEERIK